MQYDVHLAGRKIVNDRKLASLSFVNDEEFAFTEITWGIRDLQFVPGLDSLVILTVLERQRHNSEIDQIRHVYPLNALGEYGAYS